MRRIHISMVRPGERLARPIMRENGSVLLGAGVEMNERFIERLRGLGIDVVYVEDEWTSDIVPEAVIRDETYQRAFDTIYKTVGSLMDTPAYRGRASTPDLGRTFRALFGEIIHDLLQRKDIMYSLAQIHVADAYLFQHSVNVAVLAGIMGMAKGYNRNQIEELGVGALLFDIGMTKVPKELLHKTTPLTPEERAIVEKHTTEGFDMLRTQHDISLLSAHCALQHHERYDGSGYPRGLKGNEIHEYAQIIAIADVYDALTSPRSYRNRYSPSEAIEYLFAAGNTLFDLELIKLFCRHVSVYPVATTVMLNTGQIAVVTANNPLAVHRPVVRILREADGRPVSTPYEIDLKYDMQLMIVKEL
ncbi:HD-GYP domain-containing protein [Thermobacillus composti KWC4]|uniref:HD-GYP domain-containing protein n=1 Tax=Thermobacillus composti (strain DSM 18247 / JCM 13945 / KWC4) TaxID=717605 RepID=L0EBH3_THECK|nr:HD-GYP domain-containing protein [Thermobacillus composti]AGA57152.1 HD-GYP domain-containing protein [Thermobacillus composti KWC4]